MVRAAIIVCIALLAAAPALACGVMEKADPRVGSTVESANHVTLTFSQAIVPASSNITIADSDGKEVKAGKPVSSDGGMALSIKIPPLAPGKYKVSWDVLWLDCHSKTQGDYKFTVK